MAIRGMAVEWTPAPARFRNVRTAPMDPVRWRRRAAVLESLAHRRAPRWRRRETNCDGLRGWSSNRAGRLRRACRCWARALRSGEEVERAEAARSWGFPD